MNSNVIKKVNRTRVYTLMILPCMVILAVIVVVPVINLIYYSLLNYELSKPMEKGFVGFSNYLKAFGDEEFLHSIWITVLYIVGVIATELPISLLLIEVLNYIKKGSGIIKVALLPPMVVPPIIAGVMWRIMYHPTAGLVTYLLSPLGIQHPWLADRSTSLISLIIVDIWQYTPFLTLILLAGRSAIPDDRYEAGMIDGANGIQMFRYITLPLLRNSLMVGILFRVIDSIKVFPTIHIMTAGGPGNATTTINYYAYRMAFSYTNVGYSSALGFILLILTTLFSLVLVRAFKSKGDA